MENLNLKQSYENVAFLGLGGRLRSIFNFKKLFLNLKIYSRISVVFLQKLPQMTFNFFRDLPKNLRKEGSKIKISRHRIDLKKILPHFGIGILFCVVVSSSVFAQDLGYHSPGFTKETIEPVEYADLALSVDEFTPFIEEKENAMIAQLAEAETAVVSDESYILAPAELATTKSPKESIKPSSRTSYLTYQVMAGETLSNIGAKFDVFSQSMIWANPEIKDPNVLQTGSSIVIPPRDGMTVVVEKGQSLDGLVKKYSGNFEETLAANGISDSATIFAGQKILVADGRPAKKPAPKIAQKSTGSVRGAKSSPIGPTVPSGTFIWPTSGSVCQGMRRGHPAIDICAGGSSPPIVASDGGVVVQAAYGWNYGYGNTVLINHGNGFQTRYAHLRVLNVSSGQRVSQGQFLGYMGTTGNSRGIHLHFEIHMGPARLNPLAYLR